MRVVDTRGQLCPAPLIAAKKALRETPAGEPFLILTDNLTSYNNLVKFLNDNKAAVSQVEQNGAWELTVSAGSADKPDIRPEDYCSPAIAHFEKGEFIIVISSDTMGEGDVQLGKLLLGNFIKAIKDLDKLPGKIIFYNSGVVLSRNDSPHLEHLVQLEKMGVEILLCATCVSHFGIEGKTGAGIYSNMYTIAQEMATAGKVIKP
jgi:selenium metabolism protein YedF